jgi:large subunit ribosomal protein L2
MDAAERDGKLQGVVVDLVHSSGHSGPLALVRYENGEKCYNFASIGVRVGDTIEHGSQATVHRGSVMPLKQVPDGATVYNIEGTAGDGGCFVRASGTGARVVSHSDKGLVAVEMPSRKQKLFAGECRATIGVIAGSGRKDKPFVKAGVKYYWMRARNKLWPEVSGVAMNALSHPFGSGRGRHIGKSKIPPRNAPPGRNVGLIRARRTGHRR